MKTERANTQKPSIQDLPAYALGQRMRAKNQALNPEKFVSQNPEYVVLSAADGSEVASTRFPFEVFKILGSTFLQSAVFRAAERKSVVLPTKMDYKLEIEYDPATKILTGWVRSGGHCVFELATRRIKPVGRPAANYVPPIVRPTK